MTTSSHIPSSYAVLRFGGASPIRAQSELSITSAHAGKLEAIFRVARPGKMLDRMKPRFADHPAHVAAVTAAGGYPVLRR